MHRILVRGAVERDVSGFVSVAQEGEGPRLREFLVVPISGYGYERLCIQLQRHFRPENPVHARREIHIELIVIRKDVPISKRPLRRRILLYSYILRVSPATIETRSGGDVNR